MKQPTVKQLLAKIEQLEKRIAELERNRVVVVYPQPQTIFPQPEPYPFTPPPSTLPTITCSQDNGTSFFTMPRAPICIY